LLELQNTDGYDMSVCLYNFLDIGSTDGNLKKFVTLSTIQAPPKMEPFQNG
jgi:hypothetical protein